MNYLSGGLGLRYRLRYGIKFVYEYRLIVKFLNRILRPNLTGPYQCKESASSGIKNDQPNSEVF